MRHQRNDHHCLTYLYIICLVQWAACLFQHPSFEAAAGGSMGYIADRIHGQPSATSATASSTAPSPAWSGTQTWDII